MRYWARTKLPYLKAVSLVVRRFKDFGNAIGRVRRGLPLYLVPDINVRFRAQPGKHILVLSSSQFDPKATFDDRRNAEPKATFALE